MEQYSIIRTESAGVFFARVGYHDPVTATAHLTDARRLWYWAGAASLSQLAMEGVSKPRECKFPIAVTQMTVAKVIEIIPATQMAVESIKGVPVWKE